MCHPVRQPVNTYARCTPAGRTVKVVADEHLHAVARRRLVGKVQLRVGVVVDTDVERERVDAVGLCALHVTVVVRRAVAVALDPDHEVAEHHARDRLARLEPLH
jgi:hypothetical protein